MKQKTIAEIKKKKKDNHLIKGSRNRDREKKSGLLNGRIISLLDDEIIGLGN